MFRLTATPPGGSVHPDFRWAPAPATLRRLAQIEAHKVTGRAIALGKLLDAEPLREFSAEHRATMLERLAGLFKPAPPPSAEAAE